MRQMSFEREQRNFCLAWPCHLRYKLLAVKVLLSLLISLYLENWDFSIDFQPIFTSQSNENYSFSKDNEIDDKYWNDLFQQIIVSEIVVC